MPGIVVKDDEQLPYGDFRNPDRRYDDWRGRQDERMDAMKLCKDCAHYEKNADGGNCIAPQNSGSKPDFVNGGQGAEYPVYFYRAQANRESKHACGPDADWFEPKGLA